MIKIITGYSGAGGSTVAFINLAKEFIARDTPCELYGPHDWHLSKGSFCKPLSELNPKPEDDLIIHFVDLTFGKVSKRIVFSCHEMWWFDFKAISKCYDVVQFLTEKQAKYHNTIKNYVLIPNVKEEIKVNRDSSVKNIAGIIGAIEPRKNTEQSIKKALEAGCEKVLLFGAVGDVSYFRDKIIPLLNDKVQHVGYKTKEEIYSSIDRVYHMSLGEVASLVKDECYTTNTLFFGNENTDNIVSKLTNDEIIEKWKHLFETIQ